MIMLPAVQLQRIRLLPFEFNRINEAADSYT